MFCLLYFCSLGFSSIVEHKLLHIHIRAIIAIDGSSKNEIQRCENIGNWSHLVACLNWIRTSLLCKIPLYEGVVYGSLTHPIVWLKSTCTYIIVAPLHVVIEHQLIIAADCCVTVEWVLRERAEIFNIVAYIWELLRWSKHHSSSYMSMMCELLCPCRICVNYCGLCP